MRDENCDADDDEESVDNNGLPSQLIGLFAFEQKNEAWQRKDEGETTSRSGVTNDRTDRREETCHQSAYHQQYHVEKDHVKSGRPNRVEEGVHHLFGRTGNDCKVFTCDKSSLSVTVSLRLSTSVGLHGLVASLNDGFCT